MKIKKANYMGPKKRLKGPKEDQRGCFEAEKLDKRG
jgi:hypothetical protein